VVEHLHTPDELSRADPEEGDPVAVGEVHVRLDLEDEAGEGLLQGETVRVTVGRGPGGLKTP